MGFPTIFQCVCCDMDDLCLGSPRQRRGPIAMKTLPFSRPGDTRTHWSITVYTGRGAQRDPRARSVVLFCTHTPCTRVTHTHTDTHSHTMHPGLLPHEPTGLGSFHGAPGEEAALCEHPWWRHPLPLSSSSQSLNPTFHHRCDNQTIRRL